MKTPSLHMDGNGSLSITILCSKESATRREPTTLAEVRQILAQGYAAPISGDVSAPFGPVNAKNFVDRLQQFSHRYQASHFFCWHEFVPNEIQDLISILAGKKDPAMRLSLDCRIDGQAASALTARDDIAPIVQIQWHIKGPLPDLSFFKAFSRSGVWNHLVMDDPYHRQSVFHAAATQPNILHSWETTGTEGWLASSDGPYAQVRPLPGRPLWQAVDDPVERFCLVDHLTQERLLRLRIDGDGRHLFTVGSDLRYHFVPPEQLPDGYLEEICRMVAAGGTVATTHVRSNLERAYLIGYVEENGVIVGNSSLKHPRPRYIDRVRRQSGLDLTGFVERGYTSVRPEYRGMGLGTHLLAGLTQRAEGRKIFSVIGEDNAATKIIARRNRTRKVASYFSEKAGKRVGIWMPEWMIDP